MEYAWVIEIADPTMPLYWDGADWSSLRPGEDQSVMVIRGSMSSAIEVEHRLAHYNQRMGNVHDRLRQFSSSVFETMLTTKVPCIKYGRRKRRHRRLFPRMPKITIAI